MPSLDSRIAVWFAACALFFLFLAGCDIVGHMLRTQ